MSSTSPSAWDRSLPCRLFREALGPSIPSQTRGQGATTHAEVPLSDDRRRRDGRRLDPQLLRHLPRAHGDHRPRRHPRGGPPLLRRLPRAIGRPTLHLPGGGLLPHRGRLLLHRHTSRLPRAVGHAGHRARDGHPQREAHRRYMGSLCPHLSRGEVLRCPHDGHAELPLHPARPDLPADAHRAASGQTELPHGALRRRLSRVRRLGPVPPRNTALPTGRGLRAPLRSASQPRRSRLRHHRRPRVESGVE